jgi:alkylation response protein AidB-like acyl-CoA dehydrogenase
MDLELSVEQEMIKRNARDFLNKEIAPLVNKYEHEYEVLPRDIMLNLFKMITPLGYCNALIPEEEGGAGLDYLSYGILLEELARVYPSLAISEMGQSLPGRPSFLDRPKAIKDKYLPRLVANELICAVGLTEPDVGSSAPRGITTTAVLKGDEYIINGTKTWSTNGDIADIFNVNVMVDMGNGQKVPGSFVVDRAESKITTTVFSKLGLRGAGHAEIAFEDCHVPKENLMPPQQPTNYHTGRLAISTIALGIAEVAFECAIDYVRQRYQFGRPIGKFQLMQELIAEMAADIECARFLSYKGWHMMDKKTCTHLECAMPKYYNTEMALRVTSKAIEIHGAYGISDEYPLERYFRDARCLTFPDGTTEIQKLIMGREIIGLKAFT